MAVQVPDGWAQVSAGDLVLTPKCNHEGSIELYPEIARCINCLAEWMPPMRAKAEAEVERLRGIIRALEAAVRPLAAQDLPHLKDYPGETVLLQNVAGPPLKLADARHAAAALSGEPPAHRRCSMPGCPDTPTHFVGKDSTPYCGRHYGQLVKSPEPPAEEGVGDD